MHVLAIIPRTPFSDHLEFWWVAGDCGVSGGFTFPKRFSSAVGTHMCLKSRYGLCVSSRYFDKAG